MSIGKIQQTLNPLEIYRPKKRAAIQSDSIKIEATNSRKRRLDDGVNSAILTRTKRQKLLDNKTQISTVQKKIQKLRHLSMLSPLVLHLNQRTK